MSEYLHLSAGFAGDGIARDFSAANDLCILAFALLIDYARFSQRCSIITKFALFLSDFNANTRFLSAGFASDGRVRGFVGVVSPRIVHATQQ